MFDGNFVAKVLLLQCLPLHRVGNYNVHPFVLCELGNGIPTATVTVEHGVLVLKRRIHWSVHTQAPQAIHHSCCSTGRLDHYSFILVFKNSFSCRVGFRLY